MTDDPAGPVIDPPGSSRAEQPPPYQWIVWMPDARVSDRFAPECSCAHIAAHRRARVEDWRWQVSP